MTSQLGRFNQGILTNNCGAPHVYGSVGVIDTGSPSSVIDAPSAAYTESTVVVCIEPNGVADGLQGMYAIPNFIPQINLDASAAIGDYIATSATPQEGTPHAAPSTPGDFAQALETGTSPAAIGLGAGGGGGSTFSGARVVRTTNQTIPDSTATPISFDTETYDTDAYRDAGAPTRLTVPATGKYRLHGTIQWDGVAVGTLQMYIHFNGASVIAKVQTDALASGNSIIYEVNQDFAATAGQYFRLLVFQDSGSPLDVVAVSDFSAVFEIQKLG